MTPFFPFSRSFSNRFWLTTCKSAFLGFFFFSFFFLIIPSPSGPRRTSSSLIVSKELKIEIDTFTKPVRNVAASAASSAAFCARVAYLKRIRETAAHPGAWEFSGDSADIWCEMQHCVFSQTESGRDRANSAHMHTHTQGRHRVRAG
jgi:hypothetical protein